MGDEAVRKVRKLSRSVGSQAGVVRKSIFQTVGASLLVVVATGMAAMLSDKYNMGMRSYWKYVFGAFGIGLLVSACFLDLLQSGGGLVPPPDN